AEHPERHARARERRRAGPEARVEEARERAREERATGNQEHADDEVQHRTRAREPATDLDRDDARARNEHRALGVGPFGNAVEPELDGAMTDGHCRILAAPQRW